MASTNQPFKVKVDVNFLKLKYVILFVAVATGVAGGTLGIFAYYKFIPNNALSIQISQTKDNLNKKEINQLLKRIGQIAVLPTDETPEVLRITDLTQLNSNPFFENAKLGDFILIFKNNQKILVYDPLNHLLVNMGPYSQQKPKEATTSAKPLGEATPESTLQY